MWIITGLIIVAIILLIVELVLLPGISIAGISSFIAFAGAIVYGYWEYGVFWGSMVLTAAIILAIVAVVITLKSNTWHKLSLESTIDSTSNVKPEDENINIGDTGRAVTRLAPVGKVKFGDRTIEAKSPDVYIDQREEVEVIGFENSTVVVTAKK